MYKKYKLYRVDQYTKINKIWNKMESSMAKSFKIFGILNLYCFKREPFILELMILQ